MALRPEDQARVDAIEKKLAKAERRDPDPKQPIDRTHPVAFVMVLNELAQLWGGDIPKHHDQARVTMLSIYDGFISSSTRATKVKPQDCFVSAIGNIPMTELAKRTEIATLRSGWPPPLSSSRLRRTCNAAVLQRCGRLIFGRAAASGASACRR